MLIEEITFAIVLSSFSWLCFDELKTDNKIIFDLKPCPFSALFSLYYETAENSLKTERSQSFISEFSVGSL